MPLAFAMAELGDDRSRFAATKAVKAYAGAAPVTRASGKSLQVSHRRVKNQRLATADYQWAFAAPTASPGAYAHHQRRRAAGDAHPAALRNLFNRVARLPAPLPANPPALPGIRRLHPPQRHQRSGPA
jgi:transposase